MKAGVRGGGGGGYPLAIRHQTRGIDQPPWLQACIHTWPHAHTHTCKHTHANTHIHTHSHTQCTHINTLAHVCICIIHVCMCMHTCTHTSTHTQKYCWTANTSALFAIGTTQKPCIAFPTFGQLYILDILNTYSVP